MAFAKVLSYTEGNSRDAEVDWDKTDATRNGVGDMNTAEAKQKQQAAMRLWQEGRRPEALALISELRAEFPQHLGLVKLQLRWFVASQRYTEALQLCTLLSNTFRDPEAPALSAHIRRLQENVRSGRTATPHFSMSRVVLKRAAWTAAMLILVLLAAGLLIRYYTQHSVVFHWPKGAGEVFCRERGAPEGEWEALGAARGRTVLEPGRQYRLRLSPREGDAAPLDLSCLDSFGPNELAEFDCGGTTIGDTGAAHLAQHTGLKRLSLHNAGLSDAGVSHLAGLTRLTHLDLGGNAIQDEAFAHLNKLRSLVSLRLPESAGAMAIAFAAANPALEELNASRMAVGGA